MLQKLLWHFLFFVASLDDCIGQSVAQISAKARSVNISGQLRATASLRFRPEHRAHSKAKRFYGSIIYIFAWQKSESSLQRCFGIWRREERKDTRRNIGFVSCYISFSGCAASLSWWLQAPIKSCVWRTEATRSSSLRKVSSASSGLQFLCLWCFSSSVATSPALSLVQFHIKHHRGPSVYVWQRLGRLNQMSYRWFELIHLL